MQPRFIFFCFVVVVALHTTVTAQGFNITQIISGLRAGANFVDIVNRIFGVDNSTFGRIVRRIAQFDVPRSTEVYEAFEDMKKNQPDMDATNATRVDMMMGALLRNMENSGSTLEFTFVTVPVLALIAAFSVC